MLLAVVTESIYILYLADVDGALKLADFGKSRYLLKNQTAHRASTGARGWIATETFEEDADVERTISTDIQVSPSVIHMPFIQR